MRCSKIAARFFAIASRLPTDRAIANRELAQLKSSLAQIDPATGKLTVTAMTDRYLASIAYWDDKTARTRDSLATQFKATGPGGSEQPIPEVRAATTTGPSWPPAARPDPRHFSTGARGPRASP